MPDLEIACRDCGGTFVFSEADQTLFRERGFEHAPKRCRACRARHRGSRSGKSDDAGRAAPPTPAPARDPAPRPRPPVDRPMHQAVCSACTVPTEVPFVPDGVRPVFCLVCLKKRTR